MTASTDKRPQVIYVMGAGRSGSTTLGIALGNCEGVFFAGELDNWLVRAGVPQVEDEDRLAFWSSVRAELERPEAAAAMFGSDAQRAIERSLSLLRVRRWPARRRMGAAYRAVAADLYGAIARTTGLPRIADTSHYPLRAAQLQRVKGIDLYLLFLARDPQGVVASFNRRDVQEFNKSTLHTNVYLWVTHVLSMLVFLRHPRERRLFVRHERFLEDPAAVLGQIMAMTGAGGARLPDFSELRVGVPLQGNRVTRLGSIALKPAEPSPRASALTALMQAPLLALLGRLRPAAETGRLRPAAGTGRTAS